MSLCCQCYPECFGRPGVNDDFNDHKKAKRPHKLAEKYTEQVAGVLGLRRPSEVKMEGNRHVKGVHVCDCRQHHLKFSVTFYNICRRLS